MFFPTDLKLGRMVDKILRQKDTFLFILTCDYMISVRWLDAVFQGQYVPNLSINCVAINKDLEKLPPQSNCIR